MSGAKTQIFRWDQLSQDLDVPVLKALAVAETGEVEGLLREDQVLRIAEEYANVGIREVKKELIDQSGQPLRNLVSMFRGSRVVPTLAESASRRNSTGVSQAN